MKKKTAKKVKMHKFLACACKSQDFTQGQKNFARSHDRMTARFRNSEYCLTKSNRLGLIYKLKKQNSFYPIKQNLILLC